MATLRALSEYSILRIAAATYTSIEHAILISRNSRPLSEQNTQKLLATSARSATIYTIRKKLRTYCESLQGDCESLHAIPCYAERKPLPWYQQHRQQHLRLMYTATGGTAPPQKSPRRGHTCHTLPKTAATMPTATRNHGQ